MSRRSHRGRATTDREVRVGLDIADSLPDTWRLTAECDDELTEMVLIGRQWTDLFAIEPERHLAGPLGKTLLAEHQARCSACQRWAGGRTTVASPKVRP